MKMMFDKMGIDVWEVIEAAASKPFGFAPFCPGPGIGGECIAVVPMYLSWKAREVEAPTSLIDTAEIINAAMPSYVVEKIADGLNRHQKSLSQAKILLLGVGYKKDVNDIRESSSLKILSLLQKKQARVSYHDPYVPSIGYQHLQMESIDLTEHALSSFDAVVIATDHSNYHWPWILQHSALLIDTRNVTAHLPDPESKVIKA